MATSHKIAGWEDYLVDMLIDIVAIVAHAAIVDNGESEQTQAVGKHKEPGTAHRLADWTEMERSRLRKLD